MMDGINSAAPGLAQTKTWTSRDGLQLFYRDYAGNSAAPPVVCLHGLTRNSRDFEAFATRYAGKFRVIAPDFRGRGLSDRDTEPARYVPAIYATDILQLLGLLAIDTAIFVGTSLGGIVTMLIASMQPHRVAGAILNDVGPELDQRGLDRIRSYVGKMMRFSDWNEAARRIAEINGGMPDSYRQEDWLDAAHRVCKEEGGAIVFDYDMAIAEPFNRPSKDPIVDMWPLFRRLEQAPLLIIRGQESDLLSERTAIAMLDAVPGAQLATIPGVGHPPDLSEPLALSAINKFLANFLTD
jgi:pimeloyl-ACP methyl ester carboxylesterase